MLLILILLLTFTDFELSGQNIETEAISFCKIQLIEFYDTYWNIFTTFYVCISSYAREQQTSSIRKSYLGTDIFQRRFNLVGQGTPIEKNYSDTIIQAGTGST